MGDVKLLLKYFEKLGYPSLNTLSIMEAIGYKKDRFIPDLIKLIGLEETERFFERALNKMSTDDGIEVPVFESNGKDEFVYVKIKKTGILYESMFVIYDYTFTKSKLYNYEKDKYSDLETLEFESDMSEISDLDEFYHLLQEEMAHFIQINLGVSVHFGLEYIEK